MKTTAGQEIDLARRVSYLRGWRKWAALGLMLFLLAMIAVVMAAPYFS